MAPESLAAPPLSLALPPAERWRAAKNLGWRKHEQKGSLPALGGRAWNFFFVSFSGPQMAGLWGDPGGARNQIQGLYVQNWFSGLRWFAGSPCLHPFLPEILGARGLLLGRDPLGWPSAASLLRLQP